LAISTIEDYLYSLTKLLIFTFFDKQYQALSVLQELWQEKDLQIERLRKGAGVL